MNDYDVGQIMQEMEIELIRSMRRNLGRHMAWEEDEGFKWEQWQAKKIREIRKYRAKNMEIMASYSQRLNKATKNDLRRQFLEGGRKVDKEVSKVIKKGFSLYRATPSNDFFQGDNDKLDKLVNAIRNDLKQGQFAALRQMDDVYRKTIFKAETFLGSGTFTVEKAIDMATRDFLKAGINCITYSNGAHVNIASYTRMAVRTANKRVFLMGEGERKKEWGLSLVLVSQYMQCSPICLPLQGRVYIDDVYSGGKQEDGPYPLLSWAIANGLFHPNCRHTMSTYFQGISEMPEPMDKEEIGQAYERAQREAGINRNIQMYKRLKEGSLDPQNVSMYSAKVKEWEDKLSDFNAGEGLASIKQRNITMDSSQYENYKEVLGSTFLPVSLDDFQNIKYADVNEYGVIKAQVKGMGYYNKAVANEPELTDHVKMVANVSGMDMAGLKFRIKGKKSYLRKIRDSYKPDGQEYEVKDILRYTYTSEPFTLTEHALKAIEIQKDMGYNTIEIKNYWLKKFNPYNGVNTIVKAPNGQKFEIQYHTPESYRIKEKNHDMYEEWRELPQSSERAKELNRKMFDEYKGIVIPKDIERMK
jgi:hypothetical protein